jgi:hypothetical protein
MAYTFARKMKTKLIAVLFSLLAVAVSSAGKTADEHVAAVRQIGQLLAEYTQLKGATPYSENWKNDDPDDDSSPVTIIFNLSKNKIPDKLAYPPFSCHLMGHKDLEKYLAKGLGRKISLPLDDRDLEHGGRPLPLFYTIQINEGEFFVATYLTEAHKDARKLADNFYKFEVGSIAVPGKKIEKAVAPAAKK